MNNVSLVASRKAVMWCVAGLCVAAVGDLPIVVLSRINEILFASVPWFLVSIVFPFLFVLRPPHFLQQLLPSPRKQTGLWRFCAIAVALGCVAVLLTPFSAIRSGAAGLDGDEYIGGEFFKNAVSLGLPVASAVLEEIGIRGVVQWRLQSHCGLIMAEGIAFASFLGLHVLRFGEIGEVAFVCMLGFVCGRLFSKTQQILAPMLVHVGANVFVVSVALLFRQWSW